MIRATARVRDTDGEIVTPGDVLPLPETSRDPDDRRTHRCEFDHETGTSPDHGGAITVTERCACGRALRTYTDNVL